MKRVALSIAFAFFVVLLCAFPAVASPVTYTYTGNAFNQFFGLTCPPDCGISGSFTLSSAIGDNFAGDVAVLGLTAFNFTDGSIDISSKDSPASAIITMQTNASGVIVDWNISFQLGDCSSSCGILSTEGPGGGGFDLALSIANEFAASADNMNDPGTWTMTTNGATPEPSSFFLLASGLLSLGPLIRRRFAKS